MKPDALIEELREAGSHLAADAAIAALAASAADGAGTAQRGRRDPVIRDLPVERVTERVARARRAVGPRALACLAQDLHLAACIP